MDSRESSVEVADTSDWGKAMARLAEVHSLSARHDGNLHSMNSPFKQQDERFACLRAKVQRLDVEYHQVLSGGLPNNARPDDTMSEWIRRRVLKIQKLEDELRRGPNRKIVEHAEADYQARCREEEKQYFLDLLKVFGDLGRGWVMESYGLNDYIAATDMATPRSMASNASTPSPENNQADELPGGDEWDVPEDVEDPTPLAPRSNTHLTEVAAGRKRRIARTDKYRQRKRPRYNDPRGSLTGDRTIEFNQVFQGSKARTKYRIARYPPQGGAWYILECREHEKRFPKDPIHGAAKHLDSPAHEHMGRGHKQAVRELGTLVLGCNEALAAKNNAIFDRALAKDAEKPGGSRRPNNGARKSCFRPPAVRNTANIMTEDGGARVKERLWPVMFFKDGRFPNVNEISFVPASHMRPYDKADSTIRYKDEVEDFLTRRDKPTPSPSVESRGSSPTANSDHQDTPISDDAVPEDATLRQQHSRHPEIQRILEQASADFGEHAVFEEEHETDEHGDFRYDPRTGETDDEEEEEEERESVVRSTYHFRDWRQRRRFYDGDTEESAAESEEEEEEMRVDDGFDIYGDDTPRRSPPRHTRNRTTPQMRSSPNTTNLPVYDEEEDIYEDDTLRRPSTDRSGGTFNTPAPSARNVPNPQFPEFNEFWRRHSRERTTESDQQSSYSELLRVGLQMS
ncbi:Hypothetical protein NCS54_01442200 [Fusarium falciforme]|uniref:Hypothetical protein n=1 Tax=Fusarium falciforme TaxID=195108 RepID=UPI002300C82D|nr:Hypothetical protein NCS54_01442200 [Fusarium falciforme]WAO96738.1 Hypothetical protein NCS54_01442200 [Fusarium falciforme]